ncbi:MAG TPA: GNAT family N-acetyltransferase [Gemmatimonadaceae bacterium]|nr:GNAT family N-acetyltransferase [Gemmatimonadaceae bacterium]
MPHTLRPVHDGDLELLYRIYASTRAEELAVAPWTAEEKEAFLRMQFQAQHRYYAEHYREGSFDVVLVDDEPAGRLYVYRTTREIRIVDIALLPEFRGRGLGERMLRDLFAEADRAGKIVSIHVEHQNPARRLYDRLGFVAVEDGEEHPVYIRMDRPPAAPPATATLS